MNTHLLPEEDALDDPDEDGDADPTLPGDLWFRVGFSRVRRKHASGRGRGRIVYSRAFAPPGRENAQHGDQIALL
jgi:hypothetical protein